MTESLLLSLAGGVAGVGLAYGGVRLLKAVAPADFPRLDEIAVDGGVLSLALVLAMLTGLLLGVAPAVHATSRDLTAALRDDARGSLGSRRGWRTRGTLVVAELALSLVLLVGAGLLVRSFVALAELDSQFDRTGVLTARLSLDRGRYSDRASVIAFYDQLLARLGSVPGVESVAAGSSVVLPQLPNSGGISVEGQPQEPNAERVEVTTDAVTPGYFGTIGTPILLGRDFGPEDDAGSTPVTIVNEAMVRRFWPAEDPLGKRFKFGNPDGSGPWLTVVGVVADWRRTTPEREARPSSYSPHRQSATRQMMVFARTAGDPLALAGTLREAARELDSDQPVSEIITLEGLLSERLAQRRLVTLMAGLFAAIALLLALVGVYGVLSYAVAQSTREIGLRMALGGDIGRVLAMVYRRLGGLLVVGLAIGTVGAVATTRALGSLLYGVSVLDPTTFVLAPALLGAVALAACYVPARRATRVDPAVALRADA